MATETVTLKLPSGEMVDAIVPAGLDDAGVKSLMQMKHPDVFGPPAQAAGPHVDMQAHDLLGPTGQDHYPTMTETAGDAVKSLAKGAYQVSAPGIAASLLQKRSPALAAKLPAAMTQNATPAEQLPGQVVLTGMMGMGEGLGAPDVPPGAPRPAAPAPASSPASGALKGAVENAITKMALRRIPGYHLINDAVEFAKSMGWTEQAAQAKIQPQAAVSGWPAAPEVLTQAKGLMEGGKTPVDPAAGLGNLPVKTPPAEPVAPGFNKAEVSKKLDVALNDATGGKPLQPGVKLRDQGKSQPAATALPRESAVVKDFKYDPATNELHVTTGNGITYVSGDVTEAQAYAFQSAESKGQAWKAIRDNSPLVAKIIDGKRIAMKGPSGMRSAAPDAEPSTDLLEQLKKSVEKALQQKAGR